MSPARRKRNKARRNSKKKKTAWKKLVFWSLLLIVVLLVFKLTTKHWSSDSKLSLVTPGLRGDIKVATFDPSTDSITEIVVPADTEVRVARQLGTWRIKSVWKLGEDENLGGKLLAETLTRQFLIPVYIWADSKGSGFSSTEPGEILTAAISPYKTNLGIGDRIKLSMFAFGVKNFKRETVDLGSTRVLEKRQLVDGSMGYKVVSGISSSIAAVFSDPEISSLGAKTLITNASSNPSIAKEVGKIVEVIGFKTASVKEEEKVNEDLDCVVTASSDKFADMVSKLFDCKVSVHDEANFDLTISIGEKFVKRF
jgi:hypothetical protein